MKILNYHEKIVKPKNMIIIGYYFKNIPIHRKFLFLLSNSIVSWRHEQ